MFSAFKLARELRRGNLKFLRRAIDSCDLHRGEGEHYGMFQIEIDLRPPTNHGEHHAHTAETSDLEVSPDRYG